MIIIGAFHLVVALGMFAMFRRGEKREERGGIVMLVLGGEVS